MVDILSFDIPTPYPVGPVNLYLLKVGNNNILIDTGPNTEEAKRSLVNALKERNLKVEDIDYIIITHAHQDHMGLAGWIRELSGARICTHVRNAYWLTDYQGEWIRQKEYFLKFWQRNGVPDEIINRMNLFWEFFKDHSVSTEVDCFVEKDSLFVIDNFEIEIIYTPGHASGHIVLKTGGRLISGDHLLEGITSNPVLEPPLPGENERPMSLPMYMDSLKRTLNIRGINLVMPGHGKPFTGYKEVIRRRLIHYEKRKEEVYSKIGDTPRTLFEICREIFPDLPDHQRFLALSETQGHLDLLLQEKRVAIEEMGATIYYVRR